MRPLPLLDLIGLDTAQSMAESMCEEFREPLDTPTALLRRMGAAGHLGRKNGRGFHAYGAGTNLLPGGFDTRRRRRGVVPRSVCSEGARLRSVCCCCESQGPGPYV
nr:3-hydroxyacyl-CoA dehydrogenase family protein [Streptomyces sp. SP17KL33]